MRFFEFTQPQNDIGKAMAELQYVLDNAPIDPAILKKMKELAKSKNVPKLTKPVATMQPAANDQAKPSQNAPSKVAESSQSDVDQILSFLGSNPDPQLVTQMLHVIKKNAYRNLIDEVIKQKFQSKEKASQTIKQEIYQKLDSVSESVPVKVMLDFLNECLAGGVIDCPKMISAGDTDVLTRNPFPITNEAYRKIILGLCNISLSGGAASGRGEIGLAFAGMNTIKGAKDIRINEQDIEVKASAAGTDFWLKGTKGFSKDKAKRASDILLSKLNTVGGKFSLSQLKKEGGLAQITPRSTAILNPLFQKLGQVETQKLLKDVIKTLHSATSIDEFDSDIDASVNQDGSVDIRKLEIAVGKIAYFYYQKMEGHAGVLVLNVDDLTYTYIKSPSDMATAIQSLGLQATGVINFRPNSEGSTTWKLAATGSKRQSIKPAV